MNARVRSALVALSIVAAAVFACAFYWRSLLDRQSDEMAAARQRSELRATQLGEAATQELDATLRSVDLALRHLRNVYVHDAHGFERAVRDVLATYPPGMVQFVTVFGADGSLAYSSSPTQKRPYFGDREHFRVHADSDDDQLFISQPIIGRLSGTPLIQITRAIRDHGRFVGVIGMPLRPEYLSSRLGALQIDPADLLAVVRLDGSFIARSHHLEDALKSKVPPDRPFLRARPGETGFFRSPSTVDKVPLLFAWRRLSSWPLSVIAAVDEERELGLISQHQTQEKRQTLLVVALVLAFAVGLSAFLAGIRQKNVELARSEARHRALFADSKSPMLMVDPNDGAIVDANLAAAAFYGYTSDTLRRMRIADINVLTPEAIKIEMAQARSEQRDCFHFEHRLASGEIRQVEVRSGPLDVDGHTLLYSIVHDITERRTAEIKLALEAQRLAALLATASDGIHIVDESGRLIQFSHSFAAMLGYDDDEVSGFTVADWDDRIARSGDGTIVELMKCARKFETRHRRKDGCFIDVEINAKGIEIDGRAYLYASSRDISERKQAEQQLRIAAAAFDSQEGIVVTDAETRILRVNHAFTEITGYRAEDAIGKTPRLLKSGRQDPAFFAAMWDTIRRSGSWQGEIWNQRKNGQVYPQWLTITAVRDTRGSITHYVGTLTDITIRKAAEDEVRNLAYFDPLTHLPNRRLLLDRLQQAVAASARSGRAGAVLFIDLDNFKTLNDTLGHDIGDQLLQQVAQRLSSCVRDCDTVARFGGDEFVVMLEDLSAEPQEAATQAEGVGEKVLAAINQPFLLGVYRHCSTPSIGVALFCGDLASVDQLLKQADLAMYQAKARGRNTLRFFDPDTQPTVAAHSRFDDDLRAGLRQDEFQPPPSVRT